MSAFRRAVAGLPDQLLAVPVVEGALPAAGPLLVAGVGGSSMAGEFLALALAGRRDVRVVREACLPSAEDRASVLCVSYSGDTAETLAVWREARARGLAVGAVASGGRLLEEAHRAGAPRARIPSGLAPRLALGHLFGAAHAVSGASPEPARWVEAARHLREIAERWGDPRHAEPLVRGLAAGWPIVMTGNASLAPASRRWVGELAENAKVPALRWEFPEAVHNEVMILAPGAPRREAMVVVALGDASLALRAAWERTLTGLQGRGIGVHRVTAPHADPWGEALGLAYVGDWVSVHLALHLGCDPDDISFLEQLKRERAETPARDVEAT